jgi:hypothetical protein
VSCGTEFVEVYGNTRTEAKGMGDEAPGGFDTVRSLHTIFDDKDSAANWKT